MIKALAGDDMEEYIRRQQLRLQQKPQWKQQKSQGRGWKYVGFARPLL